ncbi:Molecular chaperone (HSP90 family), partial [Pseudoloma neurophilia]
MTTSEQKNAESEIHQYSCEMNNLMSIIINSMYSSKDYFLRELISNCSDACDKLNVLRTELRDKNIDIDLIQKIRIMFDKNNNRLIIQDNGIGMTKEEMINYLGCIANSGTKKFREAVQTLKNKEKVDDLIGQFGLGFYSSFLVADHVVVQSKYPGGQMYQWESSLGSFTIAPAKDENDFLHGTTVILHLKDGCKEYLKKEKITELVKKYSMFISYPILLVNEKVKSDKKEETKKVTEDS